eukprot:gb/GECH01011653.1/.p1 GENE.gb/GECH01011653.1/~~gb/GECH01011653.1/.p1  ORF type:complete len:115 (+),score=35.04 gb/GECH01011653.1/:1-345(+)
MEEFDERLTLLKDNEQLREERDMLRDRMNELINDKNELFKALQLLRYNDYSQEQPWLSATTKTTRASSSSEPSPSRSMHSPSAISTSNQDGFSSMQSEHSNYSDVHQYSSDGSV